MHSIFDSHSPSGPLDDRSDELGPSPRQRLFSTAILLFPPMYTILKKISFPTAKESRRIAMKLERELEPEGTTSMRRECDRLSKARHRALESESEALLIKVHDRASKAKKRVLEPESEALSATANV